MNRRAVGKLGEDLAAEHIRSRLGYEILERNFYTRFGEIDIIARDGDTLAFVEVKSFLHADWPEGPAVNVTAQKKKRLIRTAQAYLVKNPAVRLYCRFDVALVRSKEGQSSVDYVRGAFLA